MYLKSSSQRRMEKEARSILWRYRVQRVPCLWHDAVAWAEKHAIRLPMIRKRPIWPTAAELARYYLMLVIVEFMTGHFSFELKSGTSHFLDMLHRDKHGGVTQQVNCVSDGPTEIIPKKQPD